jgi:hypothetical protein
MEVEEVGIELEDVPAGTRAQAGLRKHLPKAENVRLKHLDGPLRRPVPPEAVHEPVDGDDTVCIEQEQREQSALLSGSQRDGVPRVHDLEGAEDPILHGRA